MPRAHKRPARRASAQAPGKKPASDPRQQLEDQLAQVVERVVAHKKEVRSRVSEVRTPDSTLHTPPVTVDDTIRGFDAVLLQHLSTQAKPRREIAIRFEEHEASPYVLPIQSSVRRVVLDEHIAAGQTIRHWLAPYTFPPNVEDLAAEAGDLRFESVDPRAFHDQFTPGEADVAYAESYRWWTKLRAPFITWEVSHYRKEASEESEASAVSDQLTPADADRAYQEVYGWKEKVAGAVSRFAHRTAETVEELEDEKDDVIAQTEQAWGVPVLVPRLQMVRVLAGFAVLLLVVSLPAGAVTLARSFGSSVRSVQQTGKDALADLRLAVAGSGAPTDAFGAASRRFQQASDQLLQANALALTAAQALPQTRSLYQSARSLLRAGEQSAEAARLLSLGFSRALDAQAVRPDERLQTFLTYVDSALPYLESARSAAGEVRADQLPEELRGQVEQLTASLAEGQSSLRDVKSMLGLLLSTAGHDRPRTYLLVFQNQTELRPTGGFMGSVAEVVLDRGEIQKVTVPGGGPYDLRDQLTVRVRPPEPLQLVAGRWEFQDANWFPDFPAAAKKIRWFWSKAGQPTLDGVVAVNASVMEKLLAVTGPIAMPEYGKTITADNFLLETQKAVELEYDKTENKPKKFIGDLMPKVLEKLKAGKKEDWLKLLGLLAESIETKDVQVAFTDADEEALAEAFGWSGQLKASPGDALAVVEANIAGQKTDAVIDERVEHRARVDVDGSIEDTVTVTRTHNGVKGELFRGANNVAYLRVYVPQGSELLEADGFQAPSSTFFKKPLEEDPEDADVQAAVVKQGVTPSGVTITDEFGYTAFGGWVQLPPGQSRTTMFRYRLPFTVQDIARRVGDGLTQNDGSAYLLYLMSQSGKANRQISTSLDLPAGWQVRWTGDVPADRAWDRDRVQAGRLMTVSTHVQTSETAQ